MEESVLAQLQTELAEAREEIASLKVRTVTTLSGTDLITILMVGPLVFAFVVLGVVIVWKTTSNPSAVAPHLDIILVAFSIFSVPISGALGAIMARYSDQSGKGGKPSASD